MSQTSLSSIGQIVRQARRAKRLSQDRLAELSSVSRARIVALKGRRPVAASESAILEYLRRTQGRFSGPQRLLSQELQIPASTLHAAIKRLEGRKLLRREKRGLVLIGGARFDTGSA